MFCTTPQNTTVQKILTTWIKSIVSVKGVALNNPIRGVAPEPHKLFEKS